MRSSTSNFAMKARNMTGFDRLFPGSNFYDLKQNVDDVKQLKSKEFSIFKPLSDLGYFSWNPKGDYIPLGSIKSSEELRRYINFEGTPNCLKSIEEIVTPKRFRSPAGTTHENKFLYGKIDIVCIHTTVKVSVGAS